MKGFDWYRAKRFFSWQLLLLLALYAIGFEVVVDLSRWLQDGAPIVLSSYFSRFLVDYPNVLFVCMINYWLIITLDKRLPWDNNSSLLPRILIETVVSALLIITQVVTVNIFISLAIGEALDFRRFIYSAILGVTINTILLLAMEFYFQYTRRYELALDMEWLKKENSEYQYEVLKQHLNPHFLFNSLNTLSSLISLDRDRAKDFVRKLSQVYRHVLEHREKKLVSLSEELKFLEDYIFLLKTRFGDALKVSVNADEGDLHKKVVPLALQALVENAVKHNAALETMPLQLNVFSDGKSISVENNRQPRQGEASWGIGLGHIKNSYKMHNQSIGIINEGTIFRVSLPLM